MNFSHRQGVVLVVGLLLLPTLALVVVSAEEQDDAPWRAAINTAAARELQAATDALQQKKWKPALRIVQELLDDKRDVLTRLPGRKGESERYVSVRGECERLLASLPEEGRQAYQRIYGPRAADLLEEALDARDDELLQRIVERYLYTDAGLAALRELARRNYTKKNYHLAALHYAQLLQHVGPARWTNDDPSQATAALHRHRDAAQAGRTLKQLLARDPRIVISWGERNLTAEALWKEIERTAVGKMDWPVYRGDAARSNRGVGSPPLLEALWRHSMVFGEVGSETVKNILRRAAERMQEHRTPISADRPLVLRPEREVEKQLHEPIISAFAPIAVTSQDAKGKNVPLLVSKTHNGIVAVEAHTGQVAWQGSSNKSLQNPLGSWDMWAPVVTGWIDFYHRHYPQILFENSTIGTLSTDGRFVYAIEDFAVPPPKKTLPNTPVPVAADAHVLAQPNSLFAFSLEKNSGKLSLVGEGIFAILVAVRRYRDADIADDFVQQCRWRHLAQSAFGSQDEAMRHHRLHHAFDIVG
jgi:hypothetical protein